ncbi:hypothetical protein [Actinomadura violacea]|uniref:Carbohydrate kinase PfkB domain-containing protein n=1 Tax=Actinomadura violacea TaxID=2819934 RepID=A0ABS3RYI4_9ACTN|nr:hypothetical protein [Actinomadura violacea]MBO2461762.1 hypothetical protein [Actinomadura violacea]
MNADTRGGTAAALGDRIVCAGTLASITCFNVSSLILDGYGEQTDTTSVLGNDAVITARILHARTLPASCLLLNPTTGDLAALADAEPGLPVQSAMTRPGAVTTSAVLQAADGRRYWLLPPSPPLTRPSGLPAPRALAGALLYLDLYDELEETVLPWLTAARPSLAGLVVNLSGSRHRAKATRLAALSPSLVQASLPRAVSAQALAQAAGKLRALTAAQHVIVSAGPHGFALCDRCGTYQHTPIRQVSGAALGAGAALSAGACAALLHGQHGHDLADHAAASVTAYLERT